MTPAPDRRVVADCENYIRGHHRWLARVATAIGRAYRLEPHMHVELLAELYEALFQRWSAELLAAGEHERNGFAYKVLLVRAQMHRGAWRRAEPSGQTAHSILTDVLADHERDVIMMMYGLDKDHTQIAAELGLSSRRISRLYESALIKLAAELPAHVWDRTSRRGAA